MKKLLVTLLTASQLFTSPSFAGAHGKKCLEIYSEALSEESPLKENGVYRAFDDVADCFRYHGDYDFGLAFLPARLCVFPFRLVSGTVKSTFTSPFIIGKYIHYRKYKPTLKLLKLVDRASESKSSNSPAYRKLTKSKIFRKLRKAQGVSSEQQNLLIDALIREYESGDFFCGDVEHLREIELFHPVSFKNVLKHRFL